ncbi:hypothetical protein [Clostridium botulinum]
MTLKMESNEIFKGISTFKKMDFAKSIKNNLDKIIPNTSPLNIETTPRNKLSIANTYPIFD